MKKKRSKPLTIYETRTHLSKLLRRVEKGEELTVARGSKVIARIVPFEHPLEDRIPGSARGRFVMSDDFDAPLPPEINKFFK